MANPPLSPPRPYPYIALLPTSQKKNLGRGVPGFRRPGPRPKALYLALPVSGRQLGHSTTSEDGRWGGRRGAGISTPDDAAQWERFQSVSDPGAAMTTASGLQTDIQKQNRNRGKEKQPLSYLEQPQFNLNPSNVHVTPFSSSPTAADTILTPSRHFDAGKRECGISPSAPCPPSIEDLQSGAGAIHLHLISRSCRS